MDKIVALVWDESKAYFFKGDEYIRYDIGADRADDGYPQPISAWALPFDGGKPAQHIEEAGGSVAVCGELSGQPLEPPVACDGIEPGGVRPRRDDGEYPGASRAVPCQPG